MRTFTKIETFPTLFAVITFTIIIYAHKVVYSNPTNLVSEIEHSAVNNFLSKILVNRLHNCTVLMLQDRFDNAQSVSHVLHKVMLNSYVVKFNSTLSRFSNNTNLLPLEFPIRMSNIRRLTVSSHCIVSVLFINEASSITMHHIREVLAPTFIPITRKDQDYYIFMANPMRHEKILLMNEFPSKIKFKIAIGSGTGLSRKNVTVTTVDFFGGSGNTPRLMHLLNDEEDDFDYFPDFFWNLKGTVLRVSIPYTRAKIESDPPWEGLKNARRGNWKYLLEEFLMVKFNFTYNMFVSTGMGGNIGGGGTGVQLENGSWVGTTGDLYSGLADLGLAVANTDRRAQYIGFTDTYYDTGCLTFVTGQPTELFSPLALIWPFSITVWICIAVSTFMGFGFFCFVIRQLNLYNPDVENKALRRINTQIRILLTPFVEQDCIAPETTPIRCFMSLWAFFALVITNLYRSKLVTLLAFPILGRLPETFEDLAFSNYKVGFMKHGDSAYNTLAASSDPVYLKLIREMEVINGVGLECLEKVINYEKYACIAYDFALVHLRERNLSDVDARKLITSHDSTYNVWLGLATEANSVYRVNFGKILGYTPPFHLANIWDKMDMYENVRRLKLDWWRDTNQSDKLEHLEMSASQDLTLKHLKGAFVLIVSGSIVSFFAFSYELLHQKLPFK